VTVNESLSLGYRFAVVRRDEALIIDEVPVISHDASAMLWHPRFPDAG
jgi:hypothetical protein